MIRSQVGFGVVEQGERKGRLVEDNGVIVDEAELGQTNIHRSNIGTAIDLAIRGVSGPLRLPSGWRRPIPSRSDFAAIPSEDFPARSGLQIAKHIKELLGRALRRE